MWTPRYKVQNILIDEKEYNIIKPMEEDLPEDSFSANLVKLAYLLPEAEKNLAFNCNRNTVNSGQTLFFKGIYRLLR